MKTINYAKGKDAVANNYYVGTIEEESVCFRKTGRYIYTDFYDTRKNSCLKHLHLNSNLIVNKVTGFKSLTKTFTTLPEGYGVSKYVEIENGDIYVLIHKYALKEGITEEMVQQEAKDAWDNSRCWSSAHLMTRID